MVFRSAFHSQPGNSEGNEPWLEAGRIGAACNLQGSHIDG
jgi:hypothetical protein